MVLLLLLRVANRSQPSNRESEEEKMSEVTKSELTSVINELRVEMQREHTANMRVMVGLIVTVWAVTLLTASTLYIIT